MKLNKREIEILEFLMQKKPQTKEIAKALKIKKSNLANYIGKLEYYGLVTITKENKKRIIILNDSISFGFLNILNDFPSLGLRDIFTGKMPFLLSFILTKKRFRLKDIDLPIMTAKRLLKKLRNLGLVYMPIKGIYELKEEAYPVADFCRDILMHMYIAEAKHELKGIFTAKFSFNSSTELEAVFGTTEENHPKSYWPTAYTVFSKYGISLMLAGKYYYSNKKPKIDDIIIHTLALGRDTRTILYVSALVIKNKFDYGKLLKKRQRFDISEEFIRNLIDFVQSKRTYKGFPSWKEVEEVAYGI